MADDLSNDAAALAKRLVGWRRDFHRRPEIAFHEFETSAVLKKFFEGLGCSVRALAGTGLRADLEGRPGGRTVALRTDMDALPLTEAPGKSYGSENPAAGPSGTAGSFFSASRPRSCLREEPDR
ncbi:MAG: hypothetical protein ABSA30_04100 [Candidatus Aminicenantales bacterium]|jgi:amidohydrolase